jgi:phytoene dehydrogenase-like protein
MILVSLSALIRSIDKIIINKNKAIGVEKNKQKYLADIVVSNMDVNLTYSKLLNGFKKPRYLKDYEPSSSCNSFLLEYKQEL